METVIFKTEIIPYTNEKNVFAFFPKDYHYNGFFTSYSHIGQHSLCLKKYADECKDAKYEEYIELYNEMTKIIGYKLKVLNKDFKKPH